MSRVPENIRAEVKALRAEIEYHGHRYYVLDDPAISDAEYDALFHRLQQLEEEWPELKDATSPTMRVGGTVLSELTSYPHSERMYSLDNAFSIADLQEFLGRATRQEPAAAQASFWLEPKMDGLAVELIYEKGKLIMALTRGDGEIGRGVRGRHQSAVGRVYGHIFPCGVRSEGNVQNYFRFERRLFLLVRFIRCGRQSDAAFRLFERRGGGQRRHALGHARRRHRHRSARGRKRHRGRGARSHLRHGYLRRRLPSRRVKTRKKGIKYD